MSNKRFNSKYAERGDIFDETELEKFYGEGDTSTGFNPGYNIFDTNEESNTFEDEQEKTKEEAAEHDRPALGPVTTTTNKPLYRQPGWTEDKTHPEGGFREKIIFDPEAWVAKIKERAALSRAERILDPVGYENARQRSEYAVQNVFNRRLMGATYAYVDQIARESEAYRCRQCDGAHNGGNEQMPSGREKEQKLCTGCFNTGHTLLEPHKSLTNLREGARKHNRFTGFHRKICAKARCHSQCLLQPLIDKNVRSRVMDPQNELKPDDVKGKPSGDRWIDNLMRPQVVSDKYEAIAKGLQILGGHETDPLKKYDVCHFVGFDTENPDGNLGGEVNPDHYTDNEHVFNAGGGSRDKQAFAVIHSISEDGTAANVIYTARPIDQIREEETTRTKGRGGKRDVNFSSMSQAMNPTAIEDVNQRGVKYHIMNAMDKITSFLGKPSPLQTVNGHDARYMSYLPNVPLDYLHRVSDISASMITYQGTHRQTVNRGRIEGSYVPLTDEQKKKNATVDVINRGNTGFSVNELRNLAKTTGNSLVLDKLNELGKDHDSDLAAVLRGNGLPDNTEEYSWVTKRPGEEISATDQDIGGPNWKNFQRLPNSTYNSGGTVLDSRRNNEPDLELPSTPLAPKINEILSTPEGTEDMLRTIRETTGKHDFSAEEEHKAIEGVRRTNSIRGGFAALGIPFEEENEE